MQFSTILTIFLVDIAAAVPTTPPNDASTTNTDTYEPDLVTFVMTVPNCPAIKDYCTHCNGDFNCQTDPRCEWCYHNKQFGTGSGGGD